MECYASPIVCGACLDGHDMSRTYCSAIATQAPKPPLHIAHNGGMRERAQAAASFHWGPGAQPRPEGVGGGGPPLTAGRGGA
jgi:hypothetical protein